MTTILITVNLPIDTVDSIRVLASRKCLSVDDMITLSYHASSASKAVIDAIKLDNHTLSTDDDASSRSQNPGSTRSLRNPEFLIMISIAQTAKYSPLKVQETTLNREVAEMVERHERVPWKGIVLRDRKEKMVYEWDWEAKASPVKMQ